LLRGKCRRHEQCAERGEGHECCTMKHDRLHNEPGETSCTGDGHSGPVLTRRANHSAVAGQHRTAYRSAAASAAGARARKIVP
jgi:hypothetical protein